MKISFIMHVPAGPAIWLRDAIDSIQKQTINSWELNLCVDNSKNCESLKILNSFENTPQIHILKSNSSLGPSEAYNLAASLASGNYLAFISPNDLLPKFSVERIILQITENSNPDFLYSDEDIINILGKCIDSDLKPDFSPELLHSCMYMSNILVIKKTVFDNLKGFRSKYDGAHYYDLALRVSHLSKSIVHIPEKLYRRRLLEDPSLKLISHQYDSEEKSFLALNDSLSKFLPIRGSAEKGLLPNTFRARFPLPKNLRATLVIITAGLSRRLKAKGNVVLITNLIQSILLKSSFKNFDLIVINNGFLDLEARNLIKSANGNVIDIKFEGKFNFSKAINCSIPHIKNEYVVLLNDDLEVISDDWLEALIELLQVDKVGAVGAKLLFENNKIQHCGMSIYNSRPYTKHIFYKTQSSEVSSDKSTHLIRNFSCITGAVLATRLSLLNLLGGFDEDLPTDYNDTDFCFRLTQLDYRIVFSPYCLLYHYENSSFKRNGLSIEAWQIFYKRWEKHLISDKFFSEEKDRKSDKYFKCRVDKLLKKGKFNIN
jgi:GT2 family glycosyltransferase